MRELTDKEKWIIEQIKESPVYIENQIVVREFHVLFYPERRVADKQYVTGFDRFYQIELTRKEISKILSGLGKLGVIRKQSYGISNFFDAGLSRNWVWSWSLVENL